MLFYTNEIKVITSEVNIDEDIVAKLQTKTVEKNNESDYH